VRVDRRTRKVRLPDLIKTMPTPFVGLSENPVPRNMDPSFFHIVLLPPAAYLLGSIPFGKLIARAVADVDITRRGSGNIGATNVAREVSLGWGLATLFLDLLKGALPVAAWLFLFSDAGLRGGGKGLAAALAVSALLGHQFPIFLRFKGGKGVATALGAFLVLAPWPCLLSALLFALVVYLRGFVSLGSLVGALALPLFMLLTAKGPALVSAALVSAALIFLRHRDNLKRLLHGEEIPWRSARLKREDPAGGPVPRRKRNE